MDIIERYYIDNNITTQSYSIYMNFIHNSKLNMKKYMKMKDIANTIKNILRLFNSEYVILLSNKYFGFYNYLLLKYFKNH